MIPETSIGDLAARVGLQRAALENEHGPGRIVAYLAPDDHPDLTEIMGLEVKRNEYVKKGLPIVVRDWCVLCGGDHFVTEHPEIAVSGKGHLTGIMDYLGKSEHLT